MALLRLKWLPETLRKDQRGFALPVVMAYALIMTMGAATLSIYSASMSLQTKRQINHARAFYLAEAANERAVADIRLFYAKFGRSPNATEVQSIQDRVLNVGAGFVVVNHTVQMNVPATQVLENGDFAGLNGTVTVFDVRSDVQSLANTGGQPSANTVAVTQEVEAQLIPIFQFGVFYQNDLEVLPGPVMNFSGPVHANGNIYVGSHNETTFESTITSAMNIYHQRKDAPSDVMNGNIRIKDSDGAYQSMKDGNVWLDSFQPNWATESQNRWGGQVRSQDHGVHSLKIPLPMGPDARTLIERGSPSDDTAVKDQKLYYKAQLRIIDGQVTDSLGNPLNLSYFDSGVGSNVNPVTTSTFYDHREGKTVRATNVNVAQLNNSPVFQSIVNGSPNGVVIYHSDYTSASSPTQTDALRLTNGGSLVTGGMTVVSENPVFIKGDYNSVGTQPAGVVGDSVSILSNAWSDANSASTNLNNRKANQTVVHTAVITGNTETTVGHYNGGFENVFRLHEKWNGNKLEYTGSVAVLYQSYYATGDWIYGSPYYEAPIRDWSFDINYSSPSYSIPGFPSAYNITKGEWKQE